MDSFGPVRNPIASSHRNRCRLNATIDDSLTPAPSPTPWFRHPPARGVGFGVSGLRTGVVPGVGRQPPSGRRSVARRPTRCSSAMRPGRCGRGRGFRTSSEADAKEASDHRTAAHRAFRRASAVGPMMRVCPPVHAADAGRSAGCTAREARGNREPPRSGADYAAACRRLDGRPAPASEHLPACAAADPRVLRRYLPLRGAGQAARPDLPRRARRRARSPTNCKPSRAYRHSRHSSGSRNRGRRPSGS